MLELLKPTASPDGGIVMGIDPTNAHARVMQCAVPTLTDYNGHTAAQCVRLLIDAGSSKPEHAGILTVLQEAEASVVGGFDFMLISC